MENETPKSVRDKLRDAIVQFVHDVQGCKSTQLVAYLGTEFAHTEEYRDAPAIITELVKEGKLIEIRYTVPNVPGCIKSLYLPKGSQIVLGSKVQVATEDGTTVYEVPKGKSVIGLETVPTEYDQPGHDFSCPVTKQPTDTTLEGD